MVDEDWNQPECDIHSPYRTSRLPSHLPFTFHKYCIYLSAIVVVFTWEIAVEQ